MKFTNYEEMMWFFGNDESQGLKAKDLSCEKFIQTAITTIKPFEYAMDLESNTISAQEEIALMLDIQPKGMALIIDYLEKKHKQALNIKIIDNSSDLKNNKLCSVLKWFSNQPEGTQLTFLLRHIGHWSTIHCERIKNKNHIAILESLGIHTDNINIIDRVFEQNNELKNNSILYKPLQHVQFDINNCGIFAIKFALLLIRERSFFHSLREGQFLLNRAEAVDYFQRTKIEPHFLANDLSELRNNYYFIFPPQFFTLHQRINYLEFYEKDFGALKGVREFSHQAKSGKIMTFREMFFREDRKQTLIEYEKLHYERYAVTKHDVLHFSEKYIKNGILEPLRNETKDVIKGRIKKYLIKTDMSFFKSAATDDCSDLASCQLSGDPLFHSG